MNEIKLAVMEKKQTLIESNNVFEFRNDKKYHWIQRLCFWTLAKIGCYHVTKDIAYETHVIDGKSLIDNLHAQKREIFSYDRHCDRVLMGNEEYMELTGNPELRNVYSFRAEADSPRGKVLGMTITVIPWMSGILAVNTSDIVE